MTKPSIQQHSKHYSRPNQGKISHKVSRCYLILCRGLSQGIFYLLTLLSIIALLSLLHIATIPLRINFRYNSSEYGRLTETKHLETPILDDLTPQQWFPLRQSHTQPPNEPQTNDEVATLHPHVVTKPINTTSSPNSTNKQQIQSHHITHPFSIPYTPVMTEPTRVQPDVQLFNVSIQPLPPNPKGYKYFMTRRLPIPLPNPWFDAFPPSQRSKAHQSTASCYSDWFPRDIMNRLRVEGGKKPTVIHQVNLDSLNLDELATYYGYKAWDEMPYHPRIPLRERNSTLPGNKDRWEHHCITPWKSDLIYSQDQQPSYYKQFFPHRAFEYTGPEDNRVWYDRCGRLMSIFGKHNDQTPIAPNWAQFVMDSRLLEPEGLLIKPLEFCHVEYQNRTMTHLIRNSFDGHSELWEKNHHELPYGFGLADMASIVILRKLFWDHATSYDNKTNSLFLTKEQYEMVKDQVMLSDNTGLAGYLRDDPTYVKSISPFTLTKGSIRMKETRLTLNQTEDWDNTSSLRQQSLSNTTTTFTYPQTIPTGLNPDRYLNDVKRVPERFDRIDPKAFESMFTSCAKKYTSVRREFLGGSLPLETIHSATNALLINITEEDWGFSPMDNSKAPLEFFLTQQDQFPSWVYISIHHDRSVHGYYRPILVFVNAVTLEIFAIQPLHWSIGSKCRHTGCEFGVGPTCWPCRMIYTHSIFANTTPLSFTTIRKIQNETQVFQSLHTVLPTIHTLKSQLFVILNQEDRAGFIQELDLKSLWYNRFNCMSPTIEEDDVMETENPLTGPDNIDHLITTNTTGTRATTQEDHKISLQEQRTLPLAIPSIEELQRGQFNYFHNPKNSKPTPLSKEQWTKTDWSHSDWFKIAFEPYQAPQQLFFFLPWFGLRVFSFYNWDMHSIILTFTTLGAIVIWVLTLLAYHWTQIWAKYTREGVLFYADVHDGQQNTNLAALHGEQLKFLLHPSLQNHTFRIPTDGETGYNRTNQTGYIAQSELGNEHDHWFDEGNETETDDEDFPLL